MLSITDHVRCVYTSVGANRLSGICSVLVLPDSRSLLAFGASHFICIANSVPVSGCCDHAIPETHALRIIDTLVGHLALVRCVRWLTNPSELLPIAERVNLLLASADSSGLVIIWSYSSYDMFKPSERDTSTCLHILTKIQLPTGRTPNGIDGCLLPSENSSTDICDRILVLSVAADTLLHFYCVKFGEDFYRTSIVANSSISRGPSLCLCLRCLCFKVDPAELSDHTARPHCLFLVLVGLDNGQIELWSHYFEIPTPESVSNLNNSWQFSLAAAAPGHQNWVRCIDSIVDTGSTEPSALIATGGQDNVIRLWRLYTLLDNLNSTKLQDSKITELKVSSNAHCHLPFKLGLAIESVLSGHDNWVTGVCWAPSPYLNIFPPNLLSSSMDKSLIVWSASSDCDLWFERVRVGNFGETGLGLLDCHWFGSKNDAILGQNFQGNFSAWHFDKKTNKWVPSLPLTGHYGPVTDLSWMARKGDLDLPLPVYLLTTGTDQTTRLHVARSTSDFQYDNETSQLFWFELARPQIHGYDMNAIASLSPFYFVSAGDEKVSRVFSATQTFLKALTATSHLDDHNFLLDSVPKSALRPALGLSTQIVPISAESLVDDKRSTLLEGDGFSESKETNESAAKFCLPTEDLLQCFTLWPEAKKLYGHPYEVHCLAAHPILNLIASACVASKQIHAFIILWNGQLDWAIHQKLVHHQLTVTQLSWSHDGNRLLAVSRDRTWSLWTAVKSHEDKIPPYHLAAYPLKSRNHSRIIWACSWSPDDKYFFTGSRDMTIGCWSGSIIANQTDELVQPESRGRLDTYRNLQHAITALDVCFFSECPSAAHVYLMAVGLESGALLLFTITQSNETEKPFKWSCPLSFPPYWCHVPGKRLRRISFESNQQDSTRKLATAGDDGLVRIFEIKCPIITGI